MSDSPSSGVVDKDCRIHGLSNGYCAGSSVFSTSGMANPMLTSLALGLRARLETLSQLNSGWAVPICGRQVFISILKKTCGTLLQEPNTTAIICAIPAT
jgi:hypothetical protein